jgi:hypothetical protein
MRLIGVSIRVSEEDHGAVCDLLTHYLEVIRQKHPVLVYELAEEERLIDPALPMGQPQVPDGSDQ